MLASRPGVQPCPLRRVGRVINLGQRTRQWRAPGNEIDVVGPPSAHVRNVIAEVDHLVRGRGTALRPRHGSHRRLIGIEPGPGRRRTIPVAATRLLDVRGGPYRQRGQAGWAGGHRLDDLPEPCVAGRKHLAGRQVVCRRVGTGHAVAAAQPEDRRGRASRIGTFESIDPGLRHRHQLIIRSAHEGVEELGAVNQRVRVVAGRPEIQDDERGRRAGRRVGADAKVVQGAAGGRAGAALGKVRAIHVIRGCGGRRRGGCRVGLGHAFDPARNLGCPDRSAAAR